MGKLTNFKNWILRRPTIYKNIGYYNGPCPLCHTHIGTVALKDRVTGLTYAHCGACGKDIFDLIKHKIHRSESEG